MKQKNLLTILVYKNIKEPIIDFPIAVYIIPDDIYENFKLPEKTEKIIIQELGYNGKFFKDKELMKIYLGEEKEINEILLSEKRIILEPNIIKDLFQEDGTKRVVTSQKDNDLIIKKIVEKDERVLSSLTEMECFIKKLNEEIIKKRIETQNQKKLLSFDN